MFTRFTRCVGEEVMKSLRAGISIILWASLMMSCGPGVLENNKGAFSVYRQESLEAQKHFVTALLENPYSPVFRYNLSISNMMAEQLSDALKELDALEASYKARKNIKEDLQQIYKIYFAKAFVYGLIQNVDAALDYYQRALRIKPDSLEIKKNIELLVQQQKGQKGKSGKPSDQESDDSSEKGDESKEKGDKEDSEGKDKDKKDPKGQDEESLKKKNLSKEEIEQILKEIRNQESKVRAKENQKNNEGKGVGNEKPW